METSRSMKTNTNTKSSSKTNTNLPSFDDIIQADRKKRKNENLASQILGKGGRKANAKDVQSRRSLGPGRSLASRIGVSKRSVSVPRGPRQSSSVWSQARRSNDNARLLRKSQQFLSAGGSTAAMTTMTTSEGDRVGYASDAFDDTGLGGGSFSRHVDNDRGSELSIRGMAGPYTIVASNFAPGTTAADISAVMEPVGGEMLGCHLVSSNPTVIAEMIFAERDGADNVVAMFNNKRADGRLLYVYHKVGGPHKFHQGSAPRSASGTANANANAYANANGSGSGSGSGNRSGRGSFKQDGDLMDTSYHIPSQPRAHAERSREPGLQDGRYGFADLDSRDKANTGRIRSDQGLFSDRIVHRNQGYRR